MSLRLGLAARVGRHSRERRGAVPVWATRGIVLVDGACAQRVQRVVFRDAVAYAEIELTVGNRAFGM